MESCTFHPTHAAIEQCEICHRPLCALCLWYGEDGQRYCPAHAGEVQQAGRHVFPPETYAEAIDSSLIPNRPAAQDQAEIPYKGNSQDLNALLAAGIGILTIASCVGGLYCLPIVGLILGISAYNNAEQAVDPARTRKLAGIGIGAAGFLILVIVGIIAFYVVAVGFALSASP